MVRDVHTHTEWSVGFSQLYSPLVSQARAMESTFPEFHMLLSVTFTFKSQFGLTFECILFSVYLKYLTHFLPA